MTQSQAAYTLEETFFPEDEPNAPPISVDIHQLSGQLRDYRAGKLPDDPFTDLALKCLLVQVERCLKAEDDGFFINYGSTSLPRKSAA